MIPIIKIGEIWIMGSFMGIWNSLSGKEEQSLL